MTKYHITFIYGGWHLWADIESPKIHDDDRRGFADIAQLAVKETLDALTQVPKKHIAHDYEIWELEDDNKGEKIAKIVYAFKTLEDE